MIETRLLIYFLAVAQERSFSRAAKKLHIAQPTLSKQISELENRLKTPLFVRTRDLQLTQAGIYLQSRAREIVQLLENTQSYFSGHGNISGTINIGTGEYRTLYPLYEVLKEFQDQYPDIRYQIHSGNGDSLFLQLSQGLLDLVFQTDPPFDEHYIYNKLDLSESWGILTRKEHPLAKKSAITPSDLYHQPLIVPSQNSHLQHALSFLSDPDYQIRASYNLIFNAAMMVQAGMGTAITLGNLIELRAYPDLVFIPFDPPIFSSLWLYRKKETVSLPAVKLLSEQLISALASDRLKQKER